MIVGGRERETLSLLEVPLNVIRSTQVAFVSEALTSISGLE